MLRGSGGRWPRSFAGRREGSRRAGARTSAGDWIALPVAVLKKAQSDDVGVALE